MVYVPGSHESVVTNTINNPTPGESIEARLVTARYKLYVGGAIDNNGISSNFTFLGDFIREMASSTKAYGIVDRVISYAPANMWGKYPKQYHVSPLSMGILLNSLNRVIKTGSHSDDFESLEALVLHYIDVPSIREEWDALDISEMEANLSFSYVTTIAPFIPEGQQPR
jgi:hypothetical protein